MRRYCLHSYRFFRFGYLSLVRYGNGERPQGSLTPVQRRYVPLSQMPHRYGSNGIPGRFTCPCRNVPVPYPPQRSSPSARIGRPRTTTVPGSLPGPSCLHHGNTLYSFHIRHFRQSCPNRPRSSFPDSLSGSWPVQAVPVDFPSYFTSLPVFNKSITLRIPSGSGRPISLAFSTIDSDSFAINPMHTASLR